MCVSVYIVKMRQLVWATLLRGFCSGQAPERLQTENRFDPIGIDVSSPRISWTLPWSGALQQAYQIRAASDGALLLHGVANLWESGKVNSAQSSQIVYGGPRLSSRDRVAWQVRVWTPEGLSDWSPPAIFEMGLPDSRDWSAQWISHPSWTYGQPLPIFAYSFPLGKPVRRAVLRIAGLGMYEAAINGQPVTLDLLTPGNTLYTARVECATHDVTALVQSGVNRIDVMLGNGMFNPVFTPGRYNDIVNPISVDLRLLAQLEVTYSDGSAAVIASGPDWRTTLGPITHSSWYGGEDYDGRRVRRTDISQWAKVMISTPPSADAKLTWRAGPPVRAFERITPVAISEPKPGIYVFDMGVNFAGWEELRVSGPAGTPIVMRIGEQLRPDSTVLQDNNSTGAPVFDTYTLAGEGIEVWHPQFVYHGFRYLQVEGLPAAPTSETITGIVLRGANDVAGSFAGSSALINGIHRMIDRAIQSNMMSIFTDCPDREKLGWLGDMIGIFGSITRNYDVSAYARTILDNMTDSQTSTGIVPTFVPTYADYSIYGEGFHDDPNWGDAMILTPWYLYETYGDVRALETYYPNMWRYLNYLTSRTRGDLLDYGLGDWITPDETIQREITATYGYYRSLVAMEKAATLLGKTTDAKIFASLRPRVEEAFNAKYLDRVNHTYAAGQQAADAVALDAGIVPDEERQAVLDHLVSTIRASGNHVNVGIVTLQAVLRALAAGGRDDVIFDIATQTTAPSYGYQLVHGATSLTEDWSGPTVGYSQNHMMLGAIDEWFTSGLAGIQQAPGSIGYEKLLIKPAIVGDLSHIEGSYRTPRGLVESSWTKSPDGGLTMRVSIPASTNAIIHVPAGPTASVAAPAGLSPSSQVNGYVLFLVGPGVYEFAVSQ